MKHKVDPQLTAISVSVNHPFHFETGHTDDGGGYAIGSQPSDWPARQNPTGHPIDPVWTNLLGGMHPVKMYYRELDKRDVLRYRGREFVFLDTVTGAGIDLHERARQAQEWAKGVDKEIDGG